MELIEKNGIVKILNRYKDYFEKNNNKCISNEGAIYMFDLFIKKINDMLVYEYLDENNCEASK